MPLVSRLTSVDWLRVSYANALTSGPATMGLNALPFW